MYKFKLTNIYKQIKEEETQPQSSQQYTIYCDMDGVIADFDKRFKDLNPEHLNAAEYQSKYGIEKFWDFIDEENKVKFWVGIPWMPDGKQLWDYIKDKQPTLLSAPSKKPASRLGKRLWVKNNIPGTPLILASADKKQNYSGGNKILIDDRPDNVDQWRSQGGIGILHTNAQNTINQLKQYGL
jgi:hypothetical protein